MKQPKPISFAAAAFTLAAFSAIAGYMLIGLGTEAQIAMFTGCAIVAIVALLHGHPWKEVEDGMVEGMYQAVEACMILLCIGLLIGVWVLAGVMPAMICYGIRLLSPTNFLVGSMLLCTGVSVAVGAWGTAGTIGLALMTISQILGIPAALTAGAIVSGSYMGDRLSPIVETANLGAAVTGTRVIDNTKLILPLNLLCLAAAGVLYWFLGLPYAAQGTMGAEVDAIVALIEDQFIISPVNFIPLVVLIVCILIKIPALPSMFAGIVSGGILALVQQKTGLQQLLHCCFYGYASTTGNEMLDALLSAGGVESMQFSLSLALSAMMLGGVMDKTGIIPAFMAPIVRRLRRRADVNAAVVVFGGIVNVVLPDSYVAITLPGKMFLSTAEEKGIPKSVFAGYLVNGSCSVPPLVPWNACGVFLYSVLGVSAWQFAPYAFVNIFVTVGAILWAYLFTEKQTAKLAAK